MGQPPRFSVVIPLHNKEGFVARTLASVLAQTWPAAEVIVVDDGSTDGSAAVAAGTGGDRVHVIRQANAGPGVARNVGFAAATGDWVALIDADDLWCPDHLATLAEVAAAFPEADAVAAVTREVGVGEQAAGIAGGALEAREIDFFRDHAPFMLNASSVAIRRVAFARTAGFAAHPAGEDSEFWIRFALDHRIAVSARPTVLYVRGTGGIMEREQARMARGEPVLPSPVFAALAAALATPAYAPRHAAIRAYGDRLRLVHARSLLFHGRGPEARALLREVESGCPRLRMYRLLALLPRPALRAVARLPGRLRRLITGRRG